ncbi:MAG: hypothetical protein KDC69_08095, partial [Flavobacteriaceae bacterium]|nr:hypothetical protein [Flavobacteriaceae bacterium]
MKHFAYILILTFFISCSQKHTDNKTKILSETDSIKKTNDLIIEKIEKDTIEKIELDTSDKRINLDLILNQKHNDYLASIN